MARLSVPQTPTSSRRIASVASQSGLETGQHSSSETTNSPRRGTQAIRLLSSASEAEVESANDTPTRSQRTPRPYRSPSKPVSHSRLHGGGSPQRREGGAARSRARLRGGYASSTATATDTEEDEGAAATAAAFPLVLLHVTLLPLPLAFEQPGAHELLPEETLHKFGQLRAKMNGEVGRRGLLVAHPGADLMALEERVLQSLDLAEGRLTRDGHFAKTLAGLGNDDGGEVDQRTDSGFESCGESVAGRRCSTCRAQIPEAGAGVAGRREWEVKVFAANGLMTAATWATAWQEMERVDVQVAPWVGEEIAQKLSAYSGVNDVLHAAGNTQHTESDRHPLEEHLEEVLAREVETAQRIAHLEATLQALQCGDNETQSRKPRIVVRTNGVGTFGAPPPVFKHEQVPLEVLLRNYFFLLAKDTRNIVIAVLLLLTSILLIQLTAARHAMRATGLHSCEVLGQTIAESLLSMRPIMAAASDLQHVNGLPPGLSGSRGPLNSTDMRDGWLGRSNYSSSRPTAAKQLEGRVDFPADYLDSD